MDNKSMYLSFGSKRAFLFVCAFLFLTVMPCLVLFVFLDIPIIIQILSDIILIATAIRCLIDFSNGFLITPKRNIFFVLGFFIKKINMDELLKIELIFNERDPDKYSAKLKFHYKSGKILVKDYYDPLKSIHIKSTAAFFFKIKKQEVEAICDQLSKINMFYITILDRDLQTVYQNKQ